MDAPWHIYPQNKELSIKIAGEIQKSEILAQVLLNRNIRSLKTVNNFINPFLGNYKKDLGYEKLVAAANLLQDAIKNKKRILIYGDYDVDGITSTSLLISFVKFMGGIVDFYIPHRYIDGYGLNTNAVKEILDKKYDLLFTLDCGISDFEEIAILKKNADIKVVVLDHHTIPDKLPDADVLINPKFLPENHCLYNICGVGVVYKFLEFYVDHFQVDYNLANDLDLVALGTIADMVPLTGENRVFVKFGLAKLEQRKRIGVDALLRVSGFEREQISVRDVGFVLAPRLNAAGRLQYASYSVDLLISTSKEEAQLKAEKLNKINQERRAIGQVILRQAEEILQEEHDLEKDKVCVLARNDWHSGVIGITASQIVNKYAKPAVLISYNEKIARGSARSVGNVNIYELLKSCSEYFEEFGGHKQAAGFGLLPQNIMGFKNKFLKLCNEKIQESELVSVLDIDVQIQPNQINKNLVKEINLLHPFGNGNTAPVLYANNFKVIDFRKVGKGKHLKGTFSDKSGKYLFDGIGFGLADKLDLLYKDSFEMAFNLELNTWAGRESVQLNILDIK